MDAKVSDKHLLAPSPHEVHLEVPKYPVEQAVIVDASLHSAIPSPHFTQTVVEEI